LENLRVLNKYFVKYKWHFLLGILFVGLSNYFLVLVPKTIREALDYIVAKTTAIDANTTAGFYELYGHEILKFAGMVIGLSVLMGFFLYCTRKTIIVMSRLIEYDMRKEIFEHYQKLDYAFYKRNKTGDLMSRISEDVSKVRMYLGPGIMYGINVAVLFTFVIFSMFKVNTTLSFYTLLPLPFLSISIYYVSSIIHDRSTRIQKQIAKLNSIAQEVYSGIRIIKSYVKEEQFGRYFDDQSEDFKVKTLELARVNALFFPLMILLASLSTLLTIYVGGILVAKGQVTAGNIAEFVIYINYLTWPITAIGWIASIVQQAEASQKRINEMLNVSPEITSITEGRKKVGGKIEFRNVSFVYPDTGIKALNNVSFVVHPGEKLAIIGRTASGKSTVADLLLRFYDATKGQIFIDDIEISERNLYELRKRIAYVPQNVFLFSDTIENNVKFGIPEAELETVQYYADSAAIHTDIDELPLQYQTLVGERGVTLSGGQKQRISIARALIKDPEIVILDDCLSAVDANTEHKILSFLNEALIDKTSIIITHRISNQMVFDRIVVLEEGEVVENGTHDQLMQIDGYYSQLIKKHDLQN
jgi:ATP-binding cassette subfamily B protein